MMKKDKYACLGGLDSSFREKPQMVMTHGEYEQIFTSKKFQTSKKKMGKGKWVWNCTLGNKVNVMYWAEMRVCVLSHIWLFVTLWTIVYQVPLSLRFPRQGNWSGLPFPTPGGLLDPGIKPKSPASPASAGRFFTTEPAGKPLLGRDRKANVCAANSSPWPIADLTSQSQSFILLS